MFDILRFRADDHLRCELLYIAQYLCICFFLDTACNYMFLRNISRLSYLGVSFGSGQPINGV